MNICSQQAKRIYFQFHFIINYTVYIVYNIQLQIYSSYLYQLEIKKMLILFLKKISYNINSGVN